MCIRFSISTKVKAFPFSMALILSVVCAVIEPLSDIFGFDVSLYKGVFIGISTFFIGVLLALALSFITPRIDKKLQILNREYFFPFLDRFYRYSPEYYIRIEEAKKIKEDLEKYGKYFRIPCYPRKLIKDVGAFFKHAEEHNKLIEKLQEISREQVGKDNLPMLFGVLNLASVNLKKYNQSQVKMYETVGNYIKQEKAELLEEIKASNKKIGELHHKIVERFEGFLKDNSLKPPKTNEVALF